ncbi:hypothetical protein [Gordonia sp. HS-NH1]|uniref:hypothetical protein n=1 Tax=Gordonia sp. HS-NH1 TaxID=1435068 RepID=UPI000A04E18C|nr:hypothetical protein [Gordonia sp. HS-NH1]
MTLYRSVADFRPDQVDQILDRAAQIKSGEAPIASTHQTIVGLAFLQASLRTRTGFAAAAIRLGATPIEVLGLRASDASMPESVESTIRILAGYTDIVVARVDQPLVVPDSVKVPVLSGGDGGPAAEHPSQALIDLFALSQLPVPISQQTIAMCGDLRMRAARSLLRLLTERRPHRLVFITDPTLREGLEWPSELNKLIEYRPLDDIADVDALYVVGIPHGAIHEEGRARLRVRTDHLESMPAHAGVFSPLPLIDEMEREAFNHPRVRIFDQSDDGLFVRAAILEFLLDVPERHFAEDHRL